MEGVFTCKRHLGLCRQHAHSTICARGRDSSRRPRVRFRIRDLWGHGHGYVYTPSSDSWAPAANMPAALYGHAASTGADGLMT